MVRRVSPYLAALLGRTALHAASVVLPEGVVLFCADSGTGKSTLALALDRAGFGVLGDDHVVLDIGDREAVRAHPSFAFIDIGHQFADGMGHGEGKYSFELATARPSSPVPVVALAFLERGSCVAREPVERTAALARLLRDFVFVADPADDEAQVARMDACLTLLETVPAVRLEIPDELERMPTSAAEVAALWSGGAL